MHPALPSCLGSLKYFIKKKAEYYIKKLNKSTYTIMSGNMHIRLYAYINNVYKLTLNAGKSYSIE